MSNETPPKDLFDSMKPNLISTILTNFLEKINISFLTEKQDYFAAITEKGNFNIELACRFLQRIVSTETLTDEQIQLCIPDDFYFSAVKIIKAHVKLENAEAFIKLIVEVFCTSIQEKKIAFTLVENRNLLDDCAQFINSNIVENENLRASLQRLLTKSTLNLK